jgi:hypothetical protein
MKIFPGGLQVQNAVAVGRDRVFLTFTTPSALIRRWTTRHRRMFTTAGQSAGSRHDHGQPQHAKELLALRVRLRGAGTIDEETEREMINKAGGST